MNGRSGEADTGPPVEPGGVALVLGAGVSGLVAASILCARGRRVHVVDSYDHVGGNHMDRTIDGCTFDVGSFIFQDDSPLLAHFPELMLRYQPIVPSWAKVNARGRISSYPFSIRDDLLASGPAEVLRVLASVTWSRYGRRKRPLASAAEFARYWLGPRLFERSGLERYMRRFCGIPADQIDIEFAEQRMMWIAEYASVRTLARHQVRKIRARWSAHAPPGNIQLARPREGFAALYRPAVERLEAAGVVFSLGRSLECLEHAPDGRFRLTMGAGASLIADEVFSTIPIGYATELCRLAVADPLPTVTLFTLFYSFIGSSKAARGFDTTILYNFTHDGPWKRLTVYSDLYGRNAGREYFAVEVIADEVSHDVEFADSAFRSHARAVGLFDGTLELLGDHTLDQAYPIFTRRAQDRAEEALRALRDFGVSSFGRQGGFEYQPTARVSTQRVEGVFGAT